MLSPCRLAWAAAWEDGRVAVEADEADAVLVKRRRRCLGDDVELLSARADEGSVSE